MKISDLKTRIVDTLNLDIVTLSSLITCVNNCFADIQSRGYREFVETTVTVDKDSNELNTLEVPIKLAIPSEFRRLTYLKVETENSWHDTARINLASAAYKGMKDSEGNERISFARLPYNYAYYILGDVIFLDTKHIGFPIESVALGYHKTLVRVPHTGTTLDTEIEIRDDLADALVLYGIYFYSMRTSLDPELIKEVKNTYRYFVEDILNNLFAEDMYSQNSNIKDEYSF